jgi:HPt (histidine-containing phosphotransfer) domain-containing protein
MSTLCPDLMKFNLINTTYIDGVAGGDIEIIREIVNIFKTQVPEFVSEMKLLANKKDFYNLGLLAHKAKSSIAIMGMENLALMLKEFEINAKDNINQEKYDCYISIFEKETAEAIIELDFFLNNH